MTRYRKLPLDNPELGSTILGTGPQKESENYSLQGVFDLFVANGINNGSVQNNVIPVFNTNPGATGLSSVAAAFNASPQITVTETQILNVVNTYQVENNNAVGVYTKCYLLRIGVGVYGEGGTSTVTDADFLEYKSDTPLVLIGTNNTTPRIEILVVDDNTLTPETLVDASSDSYTVIDGTDTFFVIKNIGSDDPDTFKTYRFTGPAGSYGSGGTATQNEWYLEIVGNTNIPVFPSSNELKSGFVTWQNGLTYLFTPLLYCIDNNLITTLGQEVTLATADATNGRIDVFYADSSGQVGVKNGTASANPLKPAIDPLTEIEVGFAIVGANATEPDGVGALTLWDENVGAPEWDETVVVETGTSSISSSNPNTGAVSIELNDFGDATVSFAAATPQNLSGISHLRFDLLQDVVAGISLSVSLQDGSTVNLSTGNYNFDPNLLGVYQEIVIPVSDFNLTVGQVDALSLKISSGVTGAVLYLDNFRFIEGIDAPAVTSCCFPALSQTFLSTQIPLDKDIKSYMTASANSFTAYTLSSVIKLGAYAKIFINTATEPTIAGAVQTGGVAWEANTDMDLILEVEQGRVIYFFLLRDIP